MDVVIFLAVVLAEILLAPAAMNERAERLQRARINNARRGR